jgi:hypothetical protein
MAVSPDSTAFHPGYVLFRWRQDKPGDGKKMMAMGGL